MKPCPGLACELTVRITKGGPHVKTVGETIQVPTLHGTATPWEGCTSHDRLFASQALAKQNTVNIGSNKYGMTRVKETNLPRGSISYPFVLWQHH